MTKIKKHDHIRIERGPDASRTGIVIDVTDYPRTGDARLSVEFSDAGPTRYGAVLASHARLIASTSPTAQASS